MNNRELSAEIAKELLEKYDVGHEILHDGMEGADLGDVVDLIFGVLNREWPD